MTTFRPDGDDAYGGGRPSPYPGGEAFEQAVGRLDDPLNDPLPGPAYPEEPWSGTYGHQAGQAAEGASQDWYAAPAHDPLLDPLPGPSYPHEPGQPGSPLEGSGGSDGWAAASAYDRPVHDEPAYDDSAYHRPGHGEPVPGASAYREPAPPAAPAPSRDDVGVRHSAPSPDPVLPRHDETVALRMPSREGTGVRDSAPSPDPVLPRHDETVALRMPSRSAARRADGGSDGGEPVPGGRAARRRAAAQKTSGRGRRARGRHSPGSAPESPAGPPQAPRSRLEARRAARAAKEPPSVIASRWIGETFITLGVLMLLFVTYQLWWTNVLAHQEAGGAASTLQDEWAKKQRDPGAFSPGQGFAILYIPKLDVKTPIAEGIDKHKVLDRGMVGHYGEDPLKTAMPWAKKGNFALAGHRNTHGEPFRYVNRLKPGDEVVVETRRAFYTYEMTSMLPQTSPSNTAVIDPVPRGSGFTKPGRYITLTTCTPEFTSTFRMIVWGRMVDERPRSKGKPDALVQ